ncbi:TRAP dicarboxylate transporter subunit DctM [Rodentibacter pneumotropicus]|nr:TRAP dicarboxylate transporter subunit DctM [Rodentibacter pneumotropicus]
MEYVSPTSHHIEPSSLVKELEKTPVGQNLQLKVSGMNPYGKQIEFYSQLSVPQGETGEQRLQNLGLTLLHTQEKIEVDGKQIDKVVIDMVETDSPAAKAGLNWDQTIIDISLPLVSLEKEWMFIPGLMIIFLVGWNQRRREKS